VRLVCGTAPAEGSAATAGIAPSRSRSHAYLPIRGLSRDGLGPALRTLSRRSTIPVQLDVTTNARLPEPIEVAAYYVASEALANATKHAQASCIEVSLATRSGRLLLSIRDDGVGGADPARGSGLVGLTDRIQALGGSVRISSRPGHGTHITAELPTGLEVETTPEHPAT
jgi:signal transduction histidine kinase